MPGIVDIMIRDYIEDAVDDSAFAINFEVQWPGTAVSYLRLAFSEEFLEKFFKIPWHKDLAAESHRLVKDQRDLLVCVGLWRTELWIEEKDTNSSLILVPDPDLSWAKKVKEGALKPKSEKQDEGQYMYYMKRD